MISHQAVEQPLLTYDVDLDKPIAEFVTKHKLPITLSPIQFMSKPVLRRGRLLEIVGHLNIMLHLKSEYAELISKSAHGA